MKKNVINIIAAVSVLFSIIVSLCPTAIAQSSAFDTGRSSIYTLPANASATPTAEQESAWTLNNSIFIQDTELTRKLNKYF